MGRLCLLVELQWEGSAINGATQSSHSKSCEFYEGWNQINVLHYTVFTVVRAIGARFLLVCHPTIVKLWPIPHSIKRGDDWPSQRCFKPKKKHSFRDIESSKWGKIGVLILAKYIFVLLKQNMYMNRVNISLFDAKMRVYRCEKLWNNLDQYLSSMASAGRREYDTFGYTPLEGDDGSLLSEHFFVLLGILLLLRSRTS